MSCEAILLILIMIEALAVLAFCKGLLIAWGFDEKSKNTRKSNNKKNKSNDK
jgi:hypothetical protein